MRSPIVKRFTCLLFLAAGALAQTAPPLAVFVQTAPSGGQVLTIQNTGAQTATAFVLKWPVQTPPKAPGKAKKLTNAGAYLLYDSASLSSAAPVAPGRPVSIANPASKATGPLQVAAVLFAGGGQWGDPAWIGKLTQRRTYTQQSLTAVVGDLNVALASHSATSDRLIAQFQSARAKEQSAATDKDQKACIGIVRGSVLRGLQLMKPGSAKAMSAFLQQEIALLQPALVKVQSAVAGH